MTHSIDVVIPAYNAGRYLGQAVQSLDRQTILADGWTVNVVIVDDGSDTPVAMPTADIVSVDLVRKPHTGTADTRNVGAARCGSPLIAFMDADDTWQPTKLEESIRALGTKPLALCTSGIFFGRYGNPMTGELVTHDGLLARDHIITSPVMTRAAFDATGGYDPTWETAEDLDFTFRALQAGVEFVHVDHPLVFYRKHAGAVTVRRRPEHRLEAIAIREKHRRAA